MVCRPLRLMTANCNGLQVTLQYVISTGKKAKYSYFVFLNSSIRGPFFPSYMPDTWQWTDAFPQRLSAYSRSPAQSCACPLLTQEVLAQR